VSELKENIIQEKSYKFGLRIVKLYLYLKENQNEYELSKQLVRSGTSIGANVEEAIGAISKKEFIAKLQVSYKEARETKYWIKLLRDSQILEVKISVSLLEDIEELIRILRAILMRSKSES